MKNNVLKWASAALLLFNVVTLQAQTTYTVDNTPNSGAQFTSIQAAINAASNGDTIYVQQSITPYSGTVANNLAIIVDKSLTLIGRSHTDQFYLTSLDSISFIENSSNSNIRGFSISSINFRSTIATTLSNYSISDNLIGSAGIGQQGSGINYNVSNVEFQGNAVTNRMNVGINVSNIVLRNNYFSGPANGGSAFSIDKPLNVIISNNVFRPGSGSNSYMI
jgi:pectin methylesterase-like acyl-CoA thioesterase